MTQIQGLSDKDFKVTIITMLRDQLETCMKEKKKPQQSRQNRQTKSNRNFRNEKQQENNRKKKLTGLTQQQNKYDNGKH